jgi:hypothetical protein
MSQRLINLSPDLTQLRDEGYAVEVRDGVLLIHEIPYVNSARKIKYGILVSDLTSVAGEVTVGPIAQHVAYFIGELPCNYDGTPIIGIHNNSNPGQKCGSVDIDHLFSSKPTPPAQYANYYEKMVTYITIIVSQAEVIDPTVTAKPLAIAKMEEIESVFNYTDTNSVKSKLSSVTAKLHGLKIGIIGLGGTGSYVLDLVAKTPVQEIHLFDGDLYLQHNAFRSPGAASIDKLREVLKKTDYFAEVYTKIRKNIYSHSEHIAPSNLEQLADMHFVFLCIDKGRVKKSIIQYLLSKGIPFIDVGMGVLCIDDFVIGQIRTTTATSAKNDHINDRIAFSEDDAVNDYATNIQIADLNALNASLAVIKWKKLFGFYQDMGKEFSTLYSINDGILINEDKEDSD